jgi:hypothetical protein
LDTKVQQVLGERERVISSGDGIFGVIDLGGAQTRRVCFCSIYGETECPKSLETLALLGWFETTNSKAENRVIVWDLPATDLRKDAHGIYECAKLQSLEVRRMRRMLKKSYILI